MEKKRNYSVAIMGPDENVKNDEPVMSTDEFLNILNRDEILTFFETVDGKGRRKSKKLARRLMKRFILEDTKLTVLRAFFILSIFNLTDYKFIREMYESAVQMAVVSQIKIIDVYYASLVLEHNIDVSICDIPADKTEDDTSKFTDVEKQIRGLAPFVRDIVFKIVDDVKKVRAGMNN